MKNKLEILNEYFQRPGVRISIAITLFNIILLSTSLIGIKLEFRSLEQLAIISLIIEFIYGTVLSFLTLRDKEKYLHLIPF